MWFLETRYWNYPPSVLENHAFPNRLMIGTDHHTPNAGDLGMIIVGASGLDASKTMTGLPWELIYPKK